MKGFLDLHLRVLYSFNSDSQLILAKSSSPTPVIPLQTKSSPGNANSPRYATVAFKTCLQTLTKCSPEILSTGADYSVYVHDPLESGSEPVAVGMGLLSKGLYSTDSNSIIIAGTIVKSHNDVESLEIRMALRTMIPPRAAQPAPDSQNNHTPQFTTTSTAPVKEAPSTRTRPTKRKTMLMTAKKPRNAAGVVELDSHTPSPSSSRTRKGKGRGSDTHPTPNSTPQPQHSDSPAPTPSPFDLISALSKTNTPSEVQNAALIAALSQIDASRLESGGGPAHGGFLAAITRMLSANGNESTSSPVPSPSPPQGNTSPPDNANDKENVSPKPPVSHKSATKNVPLASDDQPAASSSTHPSHASQPLSSPLRKRSTKDDVLCASPRRKNNVATSTPRTVFLAPPADRESRSTSPDPLPQSSPTRRTGSSPAIFQRIPASSPIRPSTKPSRKYVVPEWARTTTIGQARYPENIAKARKAEEERAEAEKAEKYRQRRLRDKERQLAKRTEKSGYRPRKAPVPPATLSKTPTPNAVAGQPVTVTPSDGPVVASSSPGLLLLSTPQSRSPRATTSVSQEPPKTPPPRKRKSTGSSLADSSLFTPKPSTPFSHCHVLHSPTQSPARKRSRRSDAQSPIRQAPLLVPETSEDDENDDDWLASELDVDHLVSSEPQSEAPSDIDEVVQLPPSSASDFQAGNESPPTKEYWDGLPPSSPILPVSSPGLPDSDFSMGAEDSEFEPLGGTADSQHHQDPNEIPSFDFGMLMGEQDPFNYFDSIFATDATNLAFLTGESVSDGARMVSSDLSNLESTALNEILPSLPLPEFWASVQPCAGGSNVSGSSNDNSSDLFTSATRTESPGSGTTARPVTFEEHVQSLFSGCVM